MIKNDPQRMAIRRSARIFIALGIFLIALSVLFVVLPSSSGQRFTYPLFYFLLILLFVVPFALVSVHLRKVDRRRALALQGDTSLLAAEQPVPNANALPLPINIELRPATRYYPFLLGLVIIGGFIGGIIAHFSSSSRSHTGHHASLTVLIIIVVISLAGLILMIALLYFKLRRQMRYRIKCCLS